MYFKILVKDNDGTNLGEFDKFKDLSFGDKLNNYGECSFSVPVLDPKSNSLYAPRRYRVEIFLCEEFTVQTKIWAGEQANRSSELTSNGDDWIEITCYGYLELLNHRFTVAERIFEIEEAIDAGDIAWSLIDESQASVSGDTGLTLPTETDTQTVPSGKVWDDSGGNFNTDLGSGENQTDYLMFKDYNFNIPPTATIKGVQVQIKGYQDKGTLDHYCYDTYVKLIKGNVIASTNKGNNVDSYLAVGTVNTYGGEFDDWSESLTPAIVNDEGFGVAISFVGHGSIINIDDIYEAQIIVYYEIIGDETSDFGITRGVVEATIDREIKYYNQNIMQAIIDLSNMSYGFDFDINSDLEFNVYGTKGVDLSDTIQLIFGKNIESCNITDDFSNPGNRAIVLGQSFDGGELIRVERDDLDSQSVIKLREYLESQSDGSDEDNLTAMGDVVLRKQKQPIRSITVKLVKNSGIVPSMFSVGDSVRVIIKKGIYDIDAQMRIHQWDFKLNSDSTQDLSLLLSIL